MVVATHASSDPSKEKSNARCVHMAISLMLINPYAHLNMHLQKNGTLVLWCVAMVIETLVWDIRVSIII